MKKTLTIGIPAHNEEKNIVALLDSIVMQTQEYCDVRAVLVICDECTDQTASLARAYAKHFPVVRVLDDGMRRGKAGRVNQMLELFESDILVMMDADTTFGTSQALDAFALAFTDHPKVGLIAGADTPYEPRTFFESVVVTTVALWRSIRTEYHGGDTVHNSHGCILALQRKFGKQIRLDGSINGDDHAFYFHAKRLGFDFKYLSEAIVFYREPDNWADFSRQRSRFHVIHEQMQEMFGDWVMAYYVSTPLSLRLQKFLRMFFQHPILFICSLGLEFWMRLYIILKKPMRASSTWQTIQSTK